jgi:hypothetical protein
MKPDMPGEKRESEGPLAFVAGAAATLIVLVAIAFILCYIITGPQRWPVANRTSLLLRMVLLVWTPLTALVSPVYAVPGYYWARARGLPRLARGILFMTATTFVLGVVGAWLLWTLANGLKGLR